MRIIFKGIEYKEVHEPMVNPHRIKIVLFDGTFIITELLDSVAAVFESDTVKDLYII